MITIEVPASTRQSSSEASTQAAGSVIAAMSKQRHEWPFRRPAGLPALEEYGAIACPTLVVRANRTTLAASRVVDLILPVLPNVEYGEIEGAGHMSPVTHPDRVNPVLERFLAKHDGGAA